MMGDGTDTEDRSQTTLVPTNTRTHMEERGVTEGKAASTKNADSKFRKQCKNAQTKDKSAGKYRISILVRLE